MHAEYHNYDDDSARSFASDPGAHLQQVETGLSASVQDRSQLLAKPQDGQQLSLDLTPVAATPEPVTAACWFADVTTTQELLTAYDLCRSEYLFEPSLVQVMLRVHHYAEQFRQQIIMRKTIGVGPAQPFDNNQPYSYLIALSSLKACFLCLK